MYWLKLPNFKTNFKTDDGFVLSGNPCLYFTFPERQQNCPLHFAFIWKYICMYRWVNKYFYIHSFSWHEQVPLADSAQGPNKDLPNICLPVAVRNLSLRTEDHIKSEFPMMHSLTYRGDDLVGAFFFRVILSYD